MADITKSYELTYNITSDSTKENMTEHLCIFEAGHKDEKAIKRSNNYGFGYILLNVMKTVTVLKDVVEHRLSPKEAFVDITTIFINNNESQLFNEFLISAYSNEKYLNAIISIYNYIVLCFDHHEFYNLDCLTRISNSVAFQFIAPRTNFTYQNSKKEDFANSNILSVEALYKLLQKNSDIIIRINSHDYSNLTELSIASLYELIDHKLNINYCRNCDKWFIEQSKNEKYCSITCADTARKKKEKARVSSGSKKALKYRRSAYDSAATSKNEEKNIQAIYEKEIFNKTADEWKEKLKIGEATEEEFIEWIKSTYVRKYKNKGAGKNG